MKNAKEIRKTEKWGRTRYAKKVSEQLMKLTEEERKKAIKIIRENYKTDATYNEYTKPFSVSKKNITFLVRELVYSPPRATGYSKWNRYESRKVVKPIN